MRSSDKLYEQTNESKTVSNNKMISGVASDGFAGAAAPRGSAASPKAMHQNLNGTVPPKEVGSVSRSINGRPSRWADEVDEDDQFLPVHAKAQSPIRKQTAEKPIPPRLPPTSTNRRSAAPPSSRDTESRYKGSSRRPERRVVDTVSSGRVVQQASAPADISEISLMKETMAKKAEEKKKLKQEEEARVEAERRARCQAKLREIEERQKTRSNSMLEERSSVEANRPSPTVIVESVNTVALDEKDKRGAFNAKRRELRQLRDAERKGNERIEIVPPVSPPPPPANLSPHAQEFFPSSSSAPMHANPPPPPHMIPMQWQHHMQHNMPPPHMMHHGMQMGPPFGYPPPQFHPYGYPPHGMGPPPNQYY